MMAQITDFILTCFRQLLDMLLGSNIVGVSIVCIPLLRMVLRSVRSIISKK